MEELDLQTLAVWSEDMYHFVMVIMDHMKKPHDYGTGVVLNMVEMHTLSLIANQPGISVGEVARQWNRTMSAASRNVDRLESKGYVEKKKLNGNGKTIHLFATSEGQALADLHRAYDEKEWRLFSRFIRERCTEEDLRQFNHVLKIIQEFYTSQELE